MINSRSKAPASKPAAAPVINVSPGRPIIHVEVPQAKPPDVVVNPEITVLPAEVILPPTAEMKIPEHPKVWDLEVTERDELGLIKRVRATAIG
jgi:hypothetical protein